METVVFFLCPSSTPDIYLFFIIYLIAVTDVIIINS